MKTKKNHDWESSYHHMSLAHTQKMVEIREKNMAFNELLTRILERGDGLSIVQDAFYELKQLKIDKRDTNKGDTQDEN